AGDQGEVLPGTLIRTVIGSGLARDRVGFMSGLIPSGPTVLAAGGCGVGDHGVGLQGAQGAAGFVDSAEQLGVVMGAVLFGVEEVLRLSEELDEQMGGVSDLLREADRAPSAHGLQRPPGKILALGGAG